MVVCAPTHLILHVSGQRLIEQQSLQSDETRTDQQDEGDSEGNFEPVQAPESIGASLGHQIDDPAGVEDQAGFHQGNDEACQHQPWDDPAVRFKLGFEIGEIGGRRRATRHAAKWVHEIFKEPKHRPDSLQLPVAAGPGSIVLVSNSEMQTCLCENPIECRGFRDPVRTGIDRLFALGRNVDEKHATSAGQGKPEYTFQHWKNTCSEELDTRRSGPTTGHYNRTGALGGW